jgi:hypothetical protein
LSTIEKIWNFQIAICTPEPDALRVQPGALVLTQTAIVGRTTLGARARGGIILLLNRYVATMLI